VVVVARGRHDSDATVANGGNADVAVTVDGERVEQRSTFWVGQHCAAVLFAEIVLDLARPRQGPLVEPALVRLGHVQPIPGWRQPNAIRREQGVHDLSNLGSVGECVVQAASISIPRPVLSVIGEPETAGVIEDQIVRAAKTVPIDAFVDRFHLAGLEINPLDRPTGVVGWLIAGEGESVALKPFEAAVVADPDLAVGTDGGTVWTATAVRDDLNGASRASSASPSSSPSGCWPPIDTTLQPPASEFDGCSAPGPHSIRNGMTPS